MDSLTNTKEVKMADKDVYMTAKELSEYVSYKYKTILQMAREKKIPTHYIGKRPRFLKSEIDKFMEIKK